MGRIIKNSLKRKFLKMVKFIAFIMAVITALCVSINNFFKAPSTSENPDTTSVVSPSESGENTSTETATFSLTQVSEYSGEAYTVINNNIPYFKTTEITTSVFETYSELDSLNRCGVAYANICKELMPTEARGEIGMVKPSGWTYSGKSNNNKYDFVDGRYIYNRCHIIGFQLAGENANVKNLITGTRYLNVEGMLPFENAVADYVKETNGHVLYRVTPIFKDNELIARGVLMEGYSVEDEGKGICFNVFCYNVQPGVEINYLTGQNYDATFSTSSSTGYIINTKTKVIHNVTCKDVKRISSEQNYVSDSINNLLKHGYTKCPLCNPK